MASLTPFTADVDGVAWTFANLDASNDVPNSGDLIVLIWNQNALPTTITFQSQARCDYGVDHATDLVITLPTNTRAVIGPFPRKRFNDASGDLIFTASITPSVTAVALEYA